MARQDGGFGGLVQRVIVIDADGARTIYRRKRKRKQQSVLFKPLEGAIRRAAEGAADGAERYLAAHDDSNREARDGWLLDVGPNVFKASRKALRRIARGIER